MARKKGLDIAKALYYVQLDGSARKTLFKGPDDYRRFTPLLETLFTEVGTSTVAWCLLQNSVHLILRPGDNGIIDTSNWLKSTYTQQYNSARGGSGSLFNSTNHCTLIEPSVYLLPCLHQLHHLPITHRLVPVLTIYPWSSHLQYLEERGPQWLERDGIINRVANQRAGRRRRYENFIQSNLATDLNWLVGTHPQYRALASESYVDRLIEQGNNSNQTQPQPE